MEDAPGRSWPILGHQSHLRIVSVHKLRHALDNVAAWKSSALSIFDLDIARIRHYLKDLHSALHVLREGFKVLESEAGASLPHPCDHSALRSFSGWIEQVSSIRDLPLDPAPEPLVWLVRWALEAKRAYLANLRDIFCADSLRWPRWIYAILKLGRYAAASMALLQLASEVPHLFNPMRLETVASPKKTKFDVVIACLCVVGLSWREPCISLFSECLRQLATNNCCFIQITLAHPTHSPN